jgi:hypothetical protein
LLKIGRSVAGKPIYNLVETNCVFMSGLCIMFVFVVMVFFGLHIPSVATLTLGSRPRQWLTRVRTKKEARESHFMLPGVQKNVREGTLTLPKELPLWELESWWTPKYLESDSRGQNLLD